MKTSTTQNKVKQATLWLISLVFWLALWQVVYLIVNKPILVVSPIEVFKNLARLSVTLDFYFIIFMTIYRILLGFTLAIVVAIPLAIATNKFKFVYTIFKPAIVVIRSTPVACFIIMALVWIKSENLPTFISFLMVLPIMWSTMTLAIEKLDKNIIQMAKVFRYTLAQKFKYVYTPMVYPYFVTALKDGLGFCFKAAIAAEVIANTKYSIGAKIYTSKIYLETLDLFTYTLVIILLSFLLEKVIVYIFSKFA